MLKENAPDEQMTSINFMKKQYENKGEPMSIYTDSPVIEVNTHGLYVEDALKAVDKAVKSAGKGVYKIKVIHGFNRGTSIRTAIYDEYKYGDNPKVKRVANGDNPGITELILKEMF